MIVTNSAEYNVLFENEWLKMDNANIEYADYSDNSWETFGYFVGQNEKSGDDQAKVISARGSGTGFETMSTHGGIVSDSEPTTNTPYPTAEKDHIEAMFNLANRYYNGEGIEKKFRKSLSLVSKSSRKR
ncbi:hypothetical protein RhiirB3_430439 [Rhizophagus irregularis]|nr:hypothetical protein RhiirB3_430439 [Rhizophagus irregularis]